MIVSVNHLSFDTYARMLFLTNQKAKYKEIKEIIILFFELYSHFFPKIDKRYDAFLAGILDMGRKFPKNINIISWNYDYELEKAFLNYFHPDTFIEDVYNNLNVFHKDADTTANPSDQFRMVKVNGTIGFLNQKKEILLGLRRADFEETSRDYLRTIDFFNDITRKPYYIPAVSFAWEGSTETNKVIVEARLIMSITEIVVVIGYSFPFFNRHVDKVFFNGDGSHYIRKIYVQDVNPDAIIQTIKGFRDNWDDVTFVPVENTDQFYMPFEL